MFHCVLAPHYYDDVDDIERTEDDNIFLRSGNDFDQKQELDYSVNNNIKKLKQYSI